MNVLGWILPPFEVDSADVCFNFPHLQLQDPVMLISKDLYPCNYKCEYSIEIRLSIGNGTVG